MWALGCVLYTLLCGFPPFYDESIQVLTEKVARGQYTFLSPWWDDISKSAQDLISHLLTVDPDKRYDIRQFLNHPWIRESQETTHAAADAPPLATPMTTRQNQYANDMFGETPGATRRADFRSPGAVNLREVFDVSYAVHRQEEEAKRRKVAGYGGGGFNALNPLDEDEEDNEEEYHAQSAPYNPNQSHIPAKQPKTNDISAMEAKMRETNLNTAANARSAPYSAAQQARQQPKAAPEAKGYGQHSAAVAAAAKRQVKQRGPFELSLDSSTLLARRGKKGPDPSGLRLELVQ